MRIIRLILTNNIDNKLNIDRRKKIHKFDKNKFSEEELKKIVVDINKSQNELVYLITNKENLFEFFNRDIFCKYFDSENEYKEIKLNTNLNFINLPNESIVNIFANNISEILNEYGSIFDINIEKLIKGTTYRVCNKKELLDLIDEDLNLIFTNGIITSRLCIIFYRLTYFDFDASKVSIGKLFSNHFGKSEPFNINLNRNSNGCFFTDLNNKIFRGYRIKPIKREIPDTMFYLKIRIARKLLSNNVKLKIVAEAIEIKEEKLKDIIYNQEVLYPQYLSIK